MSLDERACRKPDFQADSVPIKMSDGQEWYFPKPYVEFFPRIVNGKIETVGSGTTFGPEFDALVERIDANTDSVRYLDYFAITVDLLRRNYTIPDESLSGIVRHRQGNEDDVDRIAAVLGVARGIAPKASSGGEG